MDYLNRNSETATMPKIRQAPIHDFTIRSSLTLSDSSELNCHHSGGLKKLRQLVKFNPVVSVKCNLNERDICFSVSK